MTDPFDPGGGAGAAPSLSFAELRETNRLRCEAAFHRVDEWKPWEWSNAMAGEVGEACNVTKKMNRIWPANQFKQNWNKPDDQRLDELATRLEDEVADVVIYADLLLTSIGRSLATAVVKKFNEKSDEIGSAIKLAAGGPPVPARPIANFKAALRNLCGRLRVIRDTAVDPPRLSRPRDFNLDYQLGMVLDALERLAGARSSDLDALIAPAARPGEEPPDADVCREPERASGNQRADAGGGGAEGVVGAQRAPGDREGEGHHSHDGDSGKEVARPDAAPALTRFTDSEEFDAVLYAYRTAPPHMPATVVAALDAVKASVAAQLAVAQAEREKLQRQLNAERLEVIEAIARKERAQREESAHRERAEQAEAGAAALAARVQALTQQLDALVVWFRTTGHSHHQQAAIKAGSVADARFHTGLALGFEGASRDVERLRQELTAALAAAASAPHSKNDDDNETKETKNLTRVDNRVGRRSTGSTASTD